MCISTPNQLPDRGVGEMGLVLFSQVPAARRCLENCSLNAQVPFIFLSFEASADFIASPTDSELHVSLPPPQQSKYQGISILPFLISGN